MSEPIVSVVIPTFNRATRVQRAIGSALAQTHQGVEVIVVDDGSTDGTAESIARGFDDDRLIVITTRNQGVSAARNTGIRRATGTHVAFLDSDDEWFPWKLEFQLGCLDLVPGMGMVWSDMRAVNADGIEIAPRYLRTFYRHYAEVDLAAVMDGPLTVERPEFGVADVWHGDLYRPMLEGNLVHTSTALLTRERLNAVAAFDETLVRTGEDFDFHLRTCATGPVMFADTPTITYRVGAPDQLTRPDLMVQMATNYLATIEKAVASDRGRTPDRVLQRAVAHAHGWLGEELLDAGYRPEAAAHLRQALSGRRAVRAAALYVVATLPARIGGTLRRTVGRFTGPFRRRSAG